MTIVVAAAASERTTSGPQPATAEAVSAFKGIHL
jgi:hypothetical protein